MFFSQNIGHVREESFKRMTGRVCNLDAVSGGRGIPGALPDRNLKKPAVQTLCLAVLKVCKELAVLYTGINETLKSTDNL